MSLLLDANLSPRLAERLAELFPGITHVRNAGLAQASDQRIWEYARANRHTILTADSDFVDLNTTLGFPPKVVHLQRCDFPLRVIENSLRRNAIRISGMESDDALGLLVIRMP